MRRPGTDYQRLTGPEPVGPPRLRLGSGGQSKPKLTVAQGGDGSGGADPGPCSPSARNVALGSVLDPDGSPSQSTSRVKEPHSPPLCHHLARVRELGRSCRCEARGEFSAACCRFCAKSYSCRHSVSPSGSYSLSEKTDLGETILSVSKGDDSPEGQKSSCWGWGWAVRGIRA